MLKGKGGAAPQPTGQNDRQGNWTGLEARKGREWNGTQEGRIRLGEREMGDK